MRNVNNFLAFCEIYLYKRKRLRYNMPKGGVAMNKHLIDLLKQARTDCGLRQKEVAEVLGIKDNTLSNWEKGRTEPDIDTFIKLCGIYGVNSSELLERSYSLKRQVQGLNPNSSELDFIKKYRSLDPRGQQAVEDTLNREFSYSANRVDADIATDMIKTIKKVEQNLINQPVPTDKK